VPEVRGAQDETDESDAPGKDGTDLEAPENMDMEEGGRTGMSNQVGEMPQPKVSNEGYLIPTAEEQKRFMTYSILVVSPHTDYTNYCKFTKCLVNMVAYSWHYGLRIFQMGDTERMVVDWARNTMGEFGRTMVNPFTNSLYTHILWLDDDHVFNPDLAISLARHGKDMVTALYFSRLEPFLPSVYVKDASTDKYSHYPLIECPDSLFECDASGFGGMLMRRAVLDRVPKPWFTIDHRAGEDIAFCVAAREQGIKIYCDGGYKLGHVGAPMMVTEEVYRHYMKTHPEKFEGKTRVGLPN